MKFLSLIFIIVSFAISSPSFAQSKDEEFPVEAQQTENTGPYVRETHGAWEVRCVKLADNETCTLYQLLKDKNDISVAEINVEVLTEWLCSSVWLNTRRCHINEKRCKW